MAENQMTLAVVARKNNNTRSLAYGKYYFEADNSKTLSWRGFLNHLAQHALNYPRPIIDGVAAQLVGCLAELLLHLCQCLRVAEVLESRETALKILVGIGFV